MLRLIVLAVIASIACRWIFGKWPWDYLKSPPTRAQAVFHARKLLGVSATASAADIRAAHRRLSVLAHPDRGGTTVQAQELNAARDLLLDELPHETPTGDDNP